MNILSNAIDALDGEEVSNPMIRIWSEVVDSEWVAVHFADNNGGVAEEVKSRIFDPFFTTKPVGHGTGLGLSICYQIIVDMHRGELYLDAWNGVGSEFVVRLRGKH